MSSFDYVIDYNQDSDVSNYNKVLELTVQNMIKENIISEEDGTEYILNHVVLLVSPTNGFSSWFKKVFKNDNNPRLIIAKL
jgi:hypothetical protein